jgi:hypothetical protein
MYQTIYLFSPITLLTEQGIKSNIVLRILTSLALPMESQECPLPSCPPPLPRTWRGELVSRMSDQFVHSLFPPTCKFEFLPKESIDKLVLKETVIQELSDPESRFKPAQEEEFIQWILHKAPRLFLTVLDSRIVKEPYDKYYSLCSFRARGFDDDQMPWTDSSILRPIHASSDRGWFDHVWSKEMNTNFRRSQWRFVVPTITSKQFIYKLHAHQVLPFLKVVSDPKEGAFGRVYCVQVEKSHIDIGFLVERVSCYHYVYYIYGQFTDFYDLLRLL